MTSPPNGSAASAAGSEPVAITRCSQRMRDLAGVGGDDRRLAVAQRRPAAQRAHVGFLQQGADAGGQPRDDAVLPGDRLGEVDAPRRAMPSAAPSPAHEAVGGVDQRLRRDAADVEAKVADASASTKSVSTRDAADVETSRRPAAVIGLPPVDQCRARAARRRIAATIAAAEADPPMIRATLQRSSPSSPPIPPRTAAPGAPAAPAGAG